MKKMILLCIIALCACNQKPVAEKPQPKKTNTSVVIFLKSMQSHTSFSDELDYYYKGSITNTTTKKIGGVSGIIFFNDLQTDTLLTAIRIHLDNIIEPGASDTFELKSEYDPSNMEYVAYRYRKLETIKTVWQEDQVVFAE